jgi:CyaY protein
MSSESEFVAVSDRVLGAIGAAIDQSDADLDWSENDGVLTIECPDGSRLIVNRHLPNRELWVAARSGGFHFRGEGGRWRDSRSGEDLSAALARLLQLQAGAAIDFGALPAAPNS